MRCRMEGPGWDRGRCSGAFGLSPAADGAFHGPHLPSAFLLCWLNRAALGTERRIWNQRVPWSRGSCQGRDTGTARLLSCPVGAKHDGNTAGHAGSLLLVPGLTLVHRFGTLSWTSMEFASKINKNPHQLFCPSFSDSCCPHASEQKKDFHRCCLGWNFSFQWMQLHLPQPKLCFGPRVLPQQRNHHLQHTSIQPNLVPNR